MSELPRYRPRPRVVALTVGEDRVLLLWESLVETTLSAWHLNQSSAAIWAALEEEPCSAETIAQRISSEFDTGPDEVILDVTKALSELANLGLVEAL